MTISAESFNHLENVIRDKDEAIKSLETLIDVQKKVIVHLQKIINAGFREMEIEPTNENQSSF
tara:strand:- start:1732 stop:1920 length:189 start_codon:yes stop_codon:yes gene_type:complete